MEQEEFMSVGQARDFLQVTKVRMSEILRRGELKTYERGRDRRVKWVKRSEVEALKQRLDAYEPLSDAKKILPTAA